ncbi:MAG TPA: hypothetical protein VLC52_10515, partial [Anaerolineae bacterium]|nr:hypothetical protein [Anaerolineae bacterium]
MDETEHMQSLSERRRLTPAEVAAVLDQYRVEIVDSWERLGSEKLGVPNLDTAEIKARGILLLKALSDAFCTGSCEVLDQFVCKWAFMFGVHEVGIASHVLTWAQ